MEEQLIARLQREVPGEGATLYRHLCDLVGASQKAGADPLQTLENLSMELKYERFRPVAGADKRKTLAEDPVVEADKKERRKNLISLVNAGAPKAKTEDFLRASAILKVAGLGFSNEESYKIHLKVNELSQKDGLVGCRFWGKILGTEADYYVYEGVLQGTGLGSDGVEPRGTGANRTTYWVQNDPLGRLTQLSDVSVADILSSRLICKYLTGNLYKTVDACPFFHGKEIELLRAQIARINASCKLHVSGYYQIDEETNQMVPAEEFAFPAATDLLAQASWVHTSDYLLANGKTTYPNTDEMDDDQKAIIDAEIEACPEIPLLTGINADPEADEEGNSTAWSIKQLGEKSTYNFNDATKQYCVTCVSSNRWPGYYTVSQGAEVFNIYVGYATKSNPDPILTPWIGATELCLPSIMTEPPLPDEQPEPNPEEEEEASDGGDEDEAVDGE